jgi:alkylhydroperoxidase family enzyme
MNMPEAVVTAAMADWRTAPVSDKVRTTLAFLEKLTLTPAKVDSEDIRAMKVAGVTREGIEEATQVCFMFNVIDRLADALDFDIPSKERFNRAARFLQFVGYDKT